MSTPPHVQTALSLLSTFATLDVATCIALRTPSCTWHMRPTCLGYPASMNNAEHEKHLTFIASLLERFPVTVLEWWEGEGSYSGEGLDESEGKGGVRRGKTVSVLAKSVGVFKKEVRDDPSAPDSEWSFDNEYVFVFEFNEDGSRVSRVIEMLDSQAVKGVQEILGKAVANLQRKQEKEKGA